MTNLRFHDTPMRAVRRDYWCPKCQSVRVVCTGVVRLSHPPQHEHRCDACANVFGAPTPTGSVIHVPEEA